MEATISWAEAHDANVSQKTSALDTTLPHDTLAALTEELIMRFLSLLLAFAATQATAHEFWIEPLDYTVDPDAIIVGDLVNGELFEGTKFPYLPQTFTNFTQYVDGRAEPVEGRIGNRPGLQTPPLAEGLNVITYRSRANTVDYPDMAKFQRFADHKDFATWAEDHRARGLPETDFKELYTRYAKTLVAVGDGAGRDLRTGLETEIVALTNPYTSPGAPVDVQVFYRNAPRADTQVELFEKAPGGEVTVTLHRTNGNGVARLSVKPGHSYLVDAVVLREPSNAMQSQRGVVWETLWASLTFGVPG